MSIETNRKSDYSISIIRFISLCLIVICHISQELDSELAGWFNVGVQMFLVISGYLYGKKQLSGFITFYIRRIKKILVPYYITVIVSALSIFIFANDAFDLKHVISCLAIRGVFDGVQQLWFIPQILMCYLLTPLFQITLIEANTKGVRSVLFAIGIISEIIFVSFMLFMPYYNTYCIICYFIGYATGFCQKEGIYNERKLIMLFSILVSQNIVQIVYSIANINHSSLYDIIWNVWCGFNHVWLGTFLFFILKKILNLNYSRRYGTEPARCHA